MCVWGNSQESATDRTGFGGEQHTDANGSKARTQKAGRQIASTSTRTIRGGRRHGHEVESKGTREHCWSHSDLGLAENNLHEQFQLARERKRTVTLERKQKSQLLPCEVEKDGNDTRTDEGGHSGGKEQVER